MGYFADVIADARGRSTARGGLPPAAGDNFLPDGEASLAEEVSHMTTEDGRSSISASESRDHRRKAPTPEEGVASRPLQASTSDTWAERIVQTGFSGTVRDDGISAPIVAGEPENASVQIIRTNSETCVRRKAGGSPLSRELSPSVHAPLRQNPSPTNAATRLPVNAHHVERSSLPSPLSSVSIVHPAIPGKATLQPPTATSAITPPPALGRSDEQAPEAARLEPDWKAGTPRAAPEASWPLKLAGAETASAENLEIPGPPSAAAEPLTAAGVVHKREPLATARVQPLEEHSTTNSHEISTVPRVVIGSIEVIVEASARAATHSTKSPSMESSSMVSRRYLRNL